MFKIDKSIYESKKGKIYYILDYSFIETFDSMFKIKKIKNFW